MSRALAQTSSLVFRPTREQLAAAEGATIPDVIAPDLRVLFCGINPSLYSAAIGHHFGRPGNRFWPALYAAKFTPALWSPFDDAKLLQMGLGITNVVERATASADQLTATQFLDGAEQLRCKARNYRPACIAFLGVTAYRTAFQDPDAPLGRQPARIAGASVWVLPNPSGLNAHYQLADLARLFRELRLATKRPRRKSVR